VVATVAKFSRAAATDASVSASAAPAKASAKKTPPKIATGTMRLKKARSRAQVDGGVAVSVVYGRSGR
jgi:hypothetical protein